MTLILGYKAIPGESAYWFSEDRKYIRVIAGLILPQLDRQVAAVVVLGELYRSAGPVDLTGLAAKVGTWPEVENALTQFRKDLKFNPLITENEDSVELLWNSHGLFYGIGEIPLGTYAAPTWGVTEVARQKVDAMVREGRLHLDGISAILDREPEQGVRALQFAVSWIIENPMIYITSRSGIRQPRRLLGLDGL